MWTEKDTHNENEKCNWVILKILTIHTHLTYPPPTSSYPKYTLIHPPPIDP